MGEQIAAQVLFGLPGAGRIGTFLGGATGTGISPGRLRCLHALYLTLHCRTLREATVQELRVIEARTAIPNFSVGTLVVAGAIPRLAADAQLNGWS
jgi:hypothetical protein